MQKKSDLAIVLRSIPYEERHRMVIALSEEHGKMTVVAKNATHSRRFGGALEPFCAAQWNFTVRDGAEIYHLDEVILRQSFEHIRSDFERFSLASLFNELMLKLAPEQVPCPELFRLHSNALALLNEVPRANLGCDSVSGPHSGSQSSSGSQASSGSQSSSGSHSGSGSHVGVMTAWLNSYLAKLLVWSGCLPDFSSCLRCNVTLSAQPADSLIKALVIETGWLCEVCYTKEPSKSEKSYRLSARALQDLSHSLKLPIRQCPQTTTASEDAHRALFLFLEGLLIYHVPGFGERGLKSLRFLGLKSNVLRPPIQTCEKRLL